MSLTTQLTLRLDSLLSAVQDLSTPTSHIDKSWTRQLTSGTGAGQADKVWADERTLGDAANEDLDFAGALLDGLGGAFALTKLRALIIVADPANTTNLTVTPKSGAALPFITGTTPAVTPLTPGAIFLLWVPSANGITVTPSTGDSINVANSAGASAKYVIVAIGT